MAKQKYPTFICPDCGKRIPADTLQAEKARHIVQIRKNRAKVLCPFMFANNRKNGRR